MSALDDVLEEIADRVAAKVLAKLAAPSSHYTTRACSGTTPKGRTRHADGGTLPPGKPRSWALRNLKTIPGARKVGRDWIVSVADFDAWLSERDSAKCEVTQGSRSHANDVEALAAEALQAAGFRRTR